MNRSDRRWKRRTSTAAATAVGAVAGAVGTVAMDTVWYLRHRRSGGTEGPLEWEFGGVDNWDDVSAPGKVGRRVLDRLVDGTAPDRWAQSTQTVVHWGTGIGWGVQFGLVVGSRRSISWHAGLALGPIAWLSSYVLLPLAGVYKPIWEYDATTLAKDLSAHIVYGAVTGIAFASLARTRERRVA
jgi:hypothetical protein